MVYSHCNKHRCSDYTLIKHYEYYLKNNYEYNLDFGNYEKN